MIISRDIPGIGTLFNILNFTPLAEKRPQDGERVLVLWWTEEWTGSPDLVVKRWRGQDWSTTWLNYCEKMDKDPFDIKCYWVPVSEMRELLKYELD